MNNQEIYMDTLPCMLWENTKQNQDGYHINQFSDYRNAFERKKEFTKTNI